MKLIQNRKVVAIAAIMAFLLSGVVFAFAGYRTQKETFSSTDSSTVILSPDNMVSQRILGNDMCISSVDVFIKEVNASKEAKLNVMLLEGGWDTEKGVVKEKITYQVGDILNEADLRIDFSNTKLIYNRDYFIVFQLDDSKVESFVSMASSDRGQGLFVYGVNYGISLAHSREFSTYQSQFFFLWKFLFVFGGLSICLCIWRKCNLLEIMGTVTIGIALWMYLCAIAGFLKEGYFVIIAVSAVAFAYIIRWIIKNPTEEVFRMWFSNIQWGFICLLVIFIVFFIVDSGNHLSWWDELHQWGMETQSLYMFDKLPFHAKAKVSHYRYPPLNPIFQYFFLQLYGRMSDSIMLFARHLFEAALIFESFSALEKKAQNKVLFILSGILICVGLSEIFEPMIQFLVYTDMTVGVVFGFLLVKNHKLLQNYSTYGLIVLIMASMALILIKENGLAFVLAFLAGLASSVFLQFVLRKYKENSIVGFQLRVGFGIIVGTVLGELSWKLFVCNNIKYVDFYTPQSVSSVSNVGSKSRIIDYFLGAGQEYQYDIIPLHIKKLLFGDYYNANIMHFSFVLCICIFIAALICAGVLLYNDKAHFGNEIYAILSTALFAALAFHILYTFVFGEREALLLASEDRYLGSFLVGAAVFAIHVIGSDKKLDNLMVGWFLGAICVVMMLLTDSCAIYRERILCKPEISVDRVRATNLREKVTENDNVYWISKQTDQNVYHNYFYNMAPVKLYPFPVAGMGMRLYPTLDKDPDLNEFQIGVNEWKEQLSDYDYLYIEQCDDKFIEEYGSLFENSSEISSNTLYKINPENEKILQKYNYIE